MRPFAIAGMQLEVRQNRGPLDGFEQKLDRLVANFPWVQMVLLSELCLRGQNLQSAEPMPGPTEAELCRMAAKHGIWFVPGSLYELVGETIYNTTPVIDPDGRVVGRHRKLFPFVPYETGVTAGSEPLVFDVPDVGRFGISICYDMWFPETVRALTWLGAEVILHPSLTSTIDRDAEHSMIRAYGSMFQCYFFDVNVGGPLGVGQSLIAGPGGEVIHKAGKGREIIPLRLDLDYVRDVRENGWHGLGVPLKSFADSALTYPQYQPSMDLRGKTG